MPHYAIDAVLSYKTSKKRRSPRFCRPSDPSGVCKAARLCSPCNIDAVVRKGDALRRLQRTPFLAVKRVLYDTGHRSERAQGLAMQDKHARNLRSRVG